MRSTNEVKARATKLRQVLEGLGHQLKHSESLEAISKFDGYSNWNTHVADISKKQQVAEQYLDEMLEADPQLNYEKFTKHWEPQHLVSFTEKKYVRGARNILEDYGVYVSREYMGSINDFREEHSEMYPENTKHIWRAVFEKTEVIIILGVYCKNGTHYVSTIRFQ